MVVEPRSTRNRAARTFIEPVVKDVDLPDRIQSEVEDRVENEQYVEALVIAIYFD